MNVLGIGTEITECLRIARMIERHGERFIDRVYTSTETRFCQSRKQAMQYFTAYWAAKEAVFKALGVAPGRAIRPLDIELRQGKSHKIEVGLRGGMRDVVERAGVREILVSISHSRSHAIAYAMALGERCSDEDDV
ncbi:MAG TPA: holo-ACP synthase [Pirellulales bacterium]|nr:holo-ACP synthase [Pirellulales bacterium]